MPKHEIDYSNTIIYKITCNDQLISDLYVGHTTNFVQRKHAHKQSCINKKSLNYKCKLYEVIRNNGGWENWKMEIINFFNCKNHYEARKKEQEYFLSLNATLNSIEPYAIPKPKEITNKKILYCDSCNKYFNNKDLLEIHNKTKKHLKIIIIKSQSEINNNEDNKNIQIHYCKVCDYTTDRKSSYTKHLLSGKHKNHEELTSFTEPLTEGISEIICSNCEKKYKSRVGLWYHQKKCKNMSPVEPPVLEVLEPTVLDSSLNEIKVLTELVIELVKNNTELQKQNQDFQKQVLEICKNNNTTINNNSTNTNSHNKTFNLQFFLNEECKDAMNMSEFINSIQLKISDLENIGKLGYVEGMSNIIIKQLKDTDMYKRPVHCSDGKRETLYVKEENKWEKETQDTKQMLTAVRGVNKKNYHMLHNWKETHPKCTDSKSTQCDDYMKIMSKVMDGDEENMNKVIKKVAKQVLIDK